MNAFDGFPPALFDFFAALRVDNSRTFWEAHRETWENSVRAPMVALAAELAPTYGELRIMRPYRDLRFSSDKTPYRLHVAALSTALASDGYGSYIEVSDLGMTAGFGSSSFERNQLSRYRTAIDTEDTGSAFEAIRDRLLTRGISWHPGMEPPLKRAPRGFAVDHPRATSLRARGAAAMLEWPPEAWMHTREVVDRLHALWSATSELSDWLRAHVGPAMTEPAHVPNSR